MAKKNLGDLEGNNKHIGGVSALFNSPVKEDITAKRKEVEVFPEEEEIVGYPLRLKKVWMKDLKILSANTGTSVKDLILHAVAEKYKLP